MKGFIWRVSCIFEQFMSGNKKGTDAVFSNARFIAYTYSKLAADPNCNSSLPVKYFFYDWKWVRSVYLFDSADLSLSRVLLDKLTKQLIIWRALIGWLHAVSPILRWLAHIQQATTAKWLHSSWIAVMSNPDYQSLTFVHFKNSAKDKVSRRSKH